ncbi:MAG: c-type cytochrome [Novosphingobium sp.]
MTVRFATGIAVSFALALSGCGSPPEDKTSDTAAPAADSAGPSVAAADGKPAAFAQCAACHSVEPGKMGIGPSLAGVYGTKSGEIAGYTFSAAMKGANLTWDDATLDKYLTAPAKVVPGTKMTYAGLADPAARTAIIAYLKALK